jgi:hypothetical protein
VFTASIIRESKNLWNIGKFLPDYTAQHPRRQSYSHSSQWETDISSLQGVEYSRGSKYWSCTICQVSKWKKPGLYTCRWSHRCHVLLTRWTEFPMPGIRGFMLWQPVSSALVGAQLNLGPTRVSASVTGWTGFVKPVAWTPQKPISPCSYNPKKNKGEMIAGETATKWLGVCHWLRHANT